MSVVNSPNVSIYSFNFNSLLSIVHRVAFILFYFFIILFPFIVEFDCFDLDYILSYLFMFSVCLLVFLIYSYSRYFFIDWYNLCRFVLTYLFWLFLVIIVF